MCSGSALPITDEVELRWTEDEVMATGGQLSEHAKKKILAWGTNPSCGMKPGGAGFSDCNMSQPDAPENKHIVFVLEGLPGTAAEYVMAKCNLPCFRSGQINVDPGSHHRQSGPGC